MKIGIIILHFGNVNNTIACLTSLKQVVGIKYTKIYIVDNASHTITTKQITTILPKARCITNVQNLGFAGGINAGINRALQDNCTHILLLNNDVQVTPSILTGLLTGFASKNSGIVGCTILYKNSNRIWFSGGVYNTRFCFTKHIGINSDYSSKKYIAHPDFITGAVMMIKKEVFEKIGVFDQEYFLYWEDVDFCFRARKANFLCTVVPKRLAYHMVSASTGVTGSNRLSPLRAYYYARNAFMYMKKQHCITVSAFFGQCFIRLPYYLMQLQNFYAACMYFKGFFDGIFYVFSN